MARPNLGKLEKVELREYWKNESQEFTPWLATPDNIALLGETIGLDLQVEAQEKEVGPFRADILCKDVDSNTWVLIENQLEPTDHNHLGQLLTYAAGLKATTIVWIARSFTSEHRAALDWLNEISAEDFGFFGVEIELWRIGSSDPAPKFNVLCKPNNWSRSVQDSARQTGLSEARQQQLAFWTAFKEYMEKTSKIRCSPPAPQPWMSHAIGVRGCRLASVAAVWSPETTSGEIRVDFTLDDAKSKLNFSKLQEEKEDIERELDKELVWYNPPDARVCRVFSRRPADIADRTKWLEYQNWLRRELEDFLRVFEPRARRIVASGP